MSARQRVSAGARAALRRLEHHTRRLVRRTGYDISRLQRVDGAAYSRIYPEATYSPWSVAVDFMALYEAIEARTLVDIYRCYELWSLLAQTASKPGAVLEVGVYRGGTGALLAHRAAMLGISEPVYLCDTYRGIAMAGEHDSHYKGGELSETSAAGVRSFVRDELKLDNAVIVEGIFPDEGAAHVDAEQIRFCHIDVDVYESAKATCEWVWPRLSAGGIVVFDDYGFPTCDGVTTYVDSIRGMADRLVVHNLNGHAVVIKLA